MRTHISSVGLLIRSEPVLPFTYPSHIARSCIDALPPQPGIYIFRDQDGTPLYIGKSVNIRSRVLSHLRTPDEAQMLQRTTHIDFERCGGEIGALLRESQLIKKWQPAFNRKLRRTREMCSLSLEDGLPQIVFARERDFATGEHLYGLFNSRKGALETLRDIVQEYDLCCALTGLERVARGRPCFAHQLGRCRGACVGLESEQEHAGRLRAALEPRRIVRWPYPGVVGIVEESDGLRQVQLVDRWCYLGVRPEGKKRRVALPAASFDIDVYQILLRPMLAGDLTIEPVAA
ncbi:MAG: GIY-YIG nuclease family protein [Pseudomonadota bacterium]